MLRSPLRFGVAFGLMACAAWGCTSAVPPAPAGSGGAAASGGGGASGAAGSATSGGASAGSAGQGDVAGSAGASVAGASGGSGTSGSAGSSGAGADAGQSTGCGATSWPTGGLANPELLDVTNAGTTLSRQFYFALPTNYDSTRRYRLIFAWHYAGSLASTIAGTGFGGRYYGLQPLLPDSIFVAPQGLADASGTTGWPNTGGRDVAFARAMVDWMNGNFCIDRQRIMAAGFSYGAIMSHTVACQMPDVFRAIGVMAGLLIGGRGNACLDHPIAAWMTHGTIDDMVAFSSGEAARDRILSTNHCATTSQPVDPAPCVAYDGCDSGYPVVWCPVENGTHTIPAFTAGAVASFFAQF